MLSQSLLYKSLTILQRQDAYAPNRSVPTLLQDVRARHLFLLSDDPRRGLNEGCPCGKQKAFCSLHGGSALVGGAPELLDDREAKAN